VQQWLEAGVIEDGQWTKTEVGTPQGAVRLRAKLTEVKSELALRRHEPIPQQGKWLRSVVQGYFNYHGVPGNTPALEAFSTEIR
jgi:hypothetical protein